MLELNSSNFNEEVNNSNIPVLIDFFATWCGPCKAIAPSLEAISTEYEGKIKIVKLDIDSEGLYEIVSAFAIRSVPTMVIIKDKQELSRVTGGMPKQKIIEFIDTFVK